MAMNTKHSHDVVITGIGLTTAMGVGVDANWTALETGAAPIFDSERFAPYTVHPLPEIDWATQISRRDQRQMEAWQRIGTFTAGLALDDAGMKDVPELTSTMDMIIAAAGGERDIEVDEMILAEADNPDTNKPQLLNEKLTTELRPTLFLAQLSNLLAGNISIVHKVTGSSRTFMGEEGAGISALKTAADRIRAGQSTHAIVGGSYSSETPDMLLSYQLDKTIMRDGWAPVWQRGHSEGGGIVTGSGGAFLVLESRTHAEGRGAKIYATLDAIDADSGADESAALQKRLTDLSNSTGLDQTDLIISGASGAKLRTKAEMAFLGDKAHNTPVRGISSACGHLREAQFLLAVAVAALSAKMGKTPAQLDSRFESASSATPEKIGVLTVGAEDAEGVAIVSRYTGNGSPT